MRIILMVAFGIFGALLAAPMPVLAESHEVVGRIRGRNLTGQILRVWTDTKTSRYDWVIFQEGTMFRGALAPAPEEPEVFLMSLAGSFPGEETRVAGWVRLGSGFFGGRRLPWGKGRLFPVAILDRASRKEGVAMRGRERAFPFSWGEEIVFR